MSVIEATAVLFQSMPPLSPEEYSALVASVAANGVQVPVMVDEYGVTIDGHHRRRIAESLGVDCPTVVREGLTEAEKRTLALSLNVDRRHLSREQRRELIGASLKADPELSDREHARRTGASPTTVGGVRDDLESVGELSKLDSRISADGRERPATQPERPDAAPMSDTDYRGPDGKSYVIDPKPEPQQKPRNRRPITDAARDAGYELQQAVERIGRLLKDDRFNRNREEVALQLQGRLTSMVETCHGYLDQLTD